MVKFNIFIALLSFLAGVANVFVGLNSVEYSSVDIALVLAQIFLAASVVVTGLPKCGVLLENKYLSNIHKYCAITFYLFIGIVVWVLV